MIARVRDRPGALERVLGVVRRRALPIHRVSLGETAAGEYEILLRVAGDARDRERVRVELLSLVDVLDVRELRLEGDDATRELLLARVAPEAEPALRGLWRTIARDETGVLVEVTGSPAEVEAALEKLREVNPTMAFTRSGEVAAPREPSIQG